jgi:hypothetical protein
MAVGTFSVFSGFIKIQRQAFSGVVRNRSADNARKSLRVVRSNAKSISAFQSRTKLILVNYAPEILLVLALVVERGNFFDHYLNVAGATIDGSFGNWSRQARNSEMFVLDHLAGLPIQSIGSRKDFKRAHLYLFRYWELSGSGLPSSHM